MRRPLKLRVAMHPSPFGRPVGLTEILQLIEIDRIEWRLTVFEGIASPDSHLDVLDLEERARVTKGGVEFSSPELASLASSLDQVIECELQGYPLGSSGVVSAPPVVVLAAFDSTDWLVELDRDQVRIRQGSPLWPN